jgi:hypothetical protein
MLTEPLATSEEPLKPKAHRLVSVVTGERAETERDCIPEVILDLLVSTELDDGWFSD